jgi:hypothetical protein
VRPEGREAGLGHADSDNRFAVSGMTFRIKWDNNGSAPFIPPPQKGCYHNHEEVFDGKAKVQEIL